jgi:hypothetical protein
VPEAHLPGALLDVERNLQAAGEDARTRSFAELRAGLDQPELRVVVFGEFNRGKSTLINALLGRIVLPAKLVPTTGHVTQVVYGKTEGIRVRSSDGRVETAGLDRLDSISSLDLGGAAREGIEALEVAVDHPLLRSGISLIDTPGLNEKAAQTRRARAAIARADLVMLVLDARALLNLRERDLAVEWLGEGLGKPVALLVNFMNLLGDKDRVDVRARLGTWTQGRDASALGRPWFEINARGALLHALGEAAAPTDDFASFCRALAACSGEHRAAIQRRSRHGQLLAEVREARTANAGVLQRLRADAAAVEAERARAEAGLAERLRRFEADAAVRCDGVKLAAQRALDSHFAALAGQLRGQGKDRLAAYTGVWYGERLTAAAGEIEKEAAAALHSLAGQGLSRPAPLTLKELLALGARLEVGDLSPVVSDAAVGWGVGVGAVLGTFLVPVPGLGTALGAMFGSWLGKQLGATEPDYAARYTEAARQRWGADGEKIAGFLAGQLAARVAELRRELAAQLDASRGRAAGRTGQAEARSEIAHREALSRALDLCGELLQTGGKGD